MRLGNTGKIWTWMATRRGNFSNIGIGGKWIIVRSSVMPVRPYRAM